MSKEDYVRLSEFNINNFYTKGEVDLLIDNLEFGIMKKVDALPVVGEEHIIYLVPKAAPATGFDEWIWVADENRFELIGDTNIDLSDYYKKSEVDTLVNTEKTRAQGVEQALQNEILGQTGAIQTAISNANAATTAANTAAAAANNVNATLNTTTNVVTITDRTGTSKSIDLTNKTNVELEGSVITVTDKDGNESSIDLLDATNERVYVNVTTNKEGQSVEGLVINCFLNNDVDEPLQATTNANGQCYFDVPNNYHYKLVFPTIAGCDPITDVTHIAHASQRIVDVVYKETVIPPVVPDGEKLTVIAQRKDKLGYVKLEGVTVKIRVDGRDTTYTTNEAGTVTIIIPYGKQYTLTMQQREGFYLHENTYVFNFTAQQATRDLVETYYEYKSGVFIVTQDNDEYTYDEWRDMLSGKTQEEQDLINGTAKLIKVWTTQLATQVEGLPEKSGVVVGLDIDMLRERQWGGGNLKWANINTQFYSIPSNGNSISADWYYNGLGASKLIQEEGDNMGVETPAVDRCLSMSREVSDGNGGTIILAGHLGSVGQWQAVWAVAAEIDHVLEMVRPNGTHLFTTLTSQKWTSTQSTANNSWSWTTGSGSFNKITSNVVLPFFAF